eukprot:3148998-Amphidinium_carterae.1
MSSGIGSDGSDKKRPRRRKPGDQKRFKTAFKNRMPQQPTPTQPPHYGAKLVARVAARAGLLHMVGSHINSVCGFANVSDTQRNLVVLKLG